MVIPRMDTLKPQKDLTLDDIQNESWLIRVLTDVEKSKVMDVPADLLDELNSIIAECAAPYHTKKPALPVIREVSDLEDLAAKEARYVALLSRVSEITMSLYRMNKKVEEYWDLCEERINRYPIVNKELTNDRKRTLFYRSVLRPLREKQSKIELAFQMASKVESNLNSIHFAVREVSAIGREYLVRVSRTDFSNEMR